MSDDLLRRLSELHETVDLEAKAAQGKVGQGALPRSVWETYSAMANTDGGHVLLGVEEIAGGERRILGIRRPSPVLKALWDGLNNPQKVSVNLLRDADVVQHPVDDGVVIEVVVPRAGRTQRPVFIDGNPRTGTFRRDHEGDYHCSWDVVRQMMSDAGEECRTRPSWRASA